MVYGVSYCSVDYADEIKGHGFMDSKVLDHSTRVDLLQKISDETHILYKQIGWTVRVMSARDIGAGMLRPIVPYNLNAQAHDTTIQLIRDVLHQGVNVRKIFVDTVGIPETYQAKLQREFPMAEVTVSKKADSIYPIVSVASICAKVTRDKALELAVPAEEQISDDEKQKDIPLQDSKDLADIRSAKRRKTTSHEVADDGSPTPEESQDPALLQTEPSFTTDSQQPPMAISSSWGSGYPSDPRTQAWLKQTSNAIFGWRGSMVRYSWSTVKDLLDGRGKMIRERGSEILVDWHEQSTEDEVEAGQQTLTFSIGKTKKDEFSVSNWVGNNVAVNGFKSGA